MQLRTNKQEFITGIQAELPILLGVLPFGIIYGVLALAAGIQPREAQAMSAVVFAGSSQILFTQLVHLAAPWVVILLSVAVVNLRHMLYSASIAPYLQKLPSRWKWLLAYLLTDEAYAVTIFHYQQDEGSGVANKHWFLLGSGLALWLCWQLSTAAGILLGAVVPESWSLDFTLALTFIALVVPNIKDRAGAAAALCAGLLAVLAFGFPYKLGILAAGLAGIGAGMLVENLNHHQRGKT